MAAPPTSNNKGVQWASFRVFALLAALFLVAAHLPYLHLPFFWDELGQFIPAARDLYFWGALIPHSTVPNVHPPGVMLYLAGVWSVTGYSIASTRLAMLAWAWAGVCFNFLLAREFGGRDAPGMAWLASCFLLASPLFFTQSMMAQLDMPAMTLSLLVLLFFAQGWIVPAAVASVLLVWVKETSIAVPATLALWLIVERRLRLAAWFALPAIALGCWLAYLHAYTGHLFGDTEFTRYNLTASLHPAHIALTTLRRISYLCFENGHWIAAAAVALTLWRRKGRVCRLHKVALWVIVFQSAVVTILGGAGLERYLLPVLPLFYILAAEGMWRWTPRLRATAAVGLVAFLVVGWFAGPLFWPYPHENNLAMTNLIRVHQQAARFLEERYPQAAVATAWPLSAALRRPEMGYVRAPLRVVKMDDFSLEELPKAASSQVFVLYSRNANPPWNLLENRLARLIYRQYFDYRPQAGRDEPELRMGMRAAARFRHGRQWADVFVRRAPDTGGKTAGSATATLQ